MTDLEALIQFWEDMLMTSRWTMEVTIQTQIEQTIRRLKELKKLKGE